jgi:hypothetical protein
MVAERIESSRKKNCLRKTAERIGFSGQTNCP